jgi:peptide/nickel transport system permease protein
MSSHSTNPEPSRLTRLWQSNMAYSFRRNPVAVVSLMIFAVITLLALFAPLLAPFDPYDPAQIDIMNSEYPPIWVQGSDPQFMFGTDDQGRDLWSTILYGTRLSLLIGLCAVCRRASGQSADAHGRYPVVVFNTDGCDHLFGGDAGDVRVRDL